MAWRATATTSRQRAVPRRWCWWCGSQMSGWGMSRAHVISSCEPGAMLADRGLQRTPSPLRAALSPSPRYVGAEDTRPPHPGGHLARVTSPAPGSDVGATCPSLNRAAATKDAPNARAVTHTPHTTNPSPGRYICATSNPLCSHKNRKNRL